LSTDYNGNCSPIKNFDPKRHAKLKLTSAGGITTHKVEYWISVI